jgi:hypothetical protein
MSIVKSYLCQGIHCRMGERLGLAEGRGVGWVLENLEDLEDLETFLVELLTLGETCFPETVGYTLHSVVGDAT